MNRRILLLLTALVLLTGCTNTMKNNPPEIIVDGTTSESLSDDILLETETIRIRYCDFHTTITDRVGNVEYRFVTRLKRRSDAPKEAQTAADTKTIQITVDGAEIHVLDRTAQQKYIVRPKH